MPMSAYASTIIDFRSVSTWKDYRHIDIRLERVFVHFVHSKKVLKASFFAIFCSDMSDDLLEGFAFLFVPELPAAGTYAWLAEDFIS